MVLDGDAMSMAKGTPAYLQIDTLERMLKREESRTEATRKSLHAAYQCIIDATKAFTPPTDGNDVREWFDKHEATIDAVLEWKNERR